MFIRTFFSEDSILQSAVWFPSSLGSLLAWGHCKLERLLFSQPQCKLMGLIVIAALRARPYSLPFDASCVSCCPGFQGNDLRKILLICAGLLASCSSVLSDDIATHLAKQEHESMQRRHSGVLETLLQTKLDWQRGRTGAINLRNHICDMYAPQENTT